MSKHPTSGSIPSPPVPIVRVGPGPKTKVKVEDTDSGSTGSSNTIPPPPPVPSSAKPTLVFKTNIELQEEKLEEEKAQASEKTSEPPSAGRYSYIIPRSSKKRKLA
jgi:hypothetical protein